MSSCGIKGPPFGPSYHPRENANDALDLVYSTAKAIFLLSLATAVVVRRVWILKRFNACIELSINYPHSVSKVFPS